MEFLKQVFSEFSKNRCSMLAAALAYYTAFALPPLLYLLLTIMTFGMSVAYDGDEAKEKAQELLQRQTSQLIGNPAAAKEIARILENNQSSDGKWWKSLLSFGGILVGATGVVAALQSALNQVWDVKLDPETTSWKRTLRKRLLSLGIILGLGFLLLISLVVSTVLGALSDQIGDILGISGTAAESINFVVQALIVFTSFAAIFKIMPDVHVQWRNVFVGATFTTVLFLIGRFAIQLYFSISVPGAQLGSAAASLAVLLAWVYYTAMIVLLGAETTQVYAARNDPRH